MLFVLADEPGWRPRALWVHLRDFGADFRFHRREGRWVCRIPRPPVDRLEYLISVVDTGGVEYLRRDPANPHTSRGVFGDHSLLQFPEYLPPEWRGQSLDPGTTEPVLLADDQAQIVLSGDLWAPSDTSADQPMPLLVVHDGPEYADLAELLQYLNWLWARQPRTRCRILLLNPIDRDRSYSASPGYARTLMSQALPAVLHRFATTPGIVGIGASLGALALVHATVTHPGLFAGLFLQSGSFFVPRFDQHESGFAYYERLVRFVEQATAEPGLLAGLDIEMTCGTGEENLDNNQLFAAGLNRAGVPVHLRENRDGHNYCAWRDCLDPGLAGLLTRTWTREPRG